MSNEAVKQAVAGFGLSIMPLIGMKNELLSQEMHILSGSRTSYKN